MRQLGLDLTSDADVILARWRELVSSSPFLRADPHGVDELLPVVEGLIGASVLSPDDLAAHERHVRAAVAHGERRRIEGADERQLWREFEALREAIRHAMGRRALPAELRHEAQIRLDMAISVAEMAAIRGFHRRMLERAGVWSELIPSMIRQSPLLDLPAPVQSP